MKLRLLSASLLALAFAVPAVLHSQDAAPEHHTEIGKHMKSAGDIFKKLRKQVSDSSQNDSTLELVGQMRKEFQAILDLKGSDAKPELEKDKPAEKQPEFQSQFESGIKDFMSQLDKLADLIKAGDNAGAAKQLQSLGTLERKDHKQFRKPHDE